jgi:O-methyltransferase
MRIKHCINMLSKVLGVEGDVVECGVASGANTFPMADIVKSSKTGKTVYACDTFQGLPYDDCFEQGHKKGEFNYGNNFKIIQSMRTDLPIVRVEGTVEETLATELIEKKFCFVFLDMDLYEPTKYAISFFKNKISVGGILGLHDFDWEKCPGIRKAIEEELSINYIPIMCEDYTIFFQRVY